MPTLRASVVALCSVLVINNRGRPPAVAPTSGSFSAHDAHSFSFDGCRERGLGTGAMLRSRLADATLLGAQTPGFLAPPS